MITLNIKTTDTDQDIGSLVVDGDEFQSGAEEHQRMVLSRTRFSEKETLEARCREAYPYENGYVFVDLVEG